MRIMRAQLGEKNVFSLDLVLEGSDDHKVAHAILTALEHSMAIAVELQAKPIADTHRKK